MSNEIDVIFFRRTPITAAVFSGDGSCLALAAKTVITIWHPLKNELLYVVGKANAVRLV